MKEVKDNLGTLSRSTGKSCFVVLDPIVVWIPVVIRYLSTFYPVLLFLSLYLFRFVSFF